ncbi:MAG: hypothetical protein WC819_03285 [Parcubacteria group bacterium]
MNFSRDHDRVIPQKCPVCGASRDHLSYMPLGHDEDRTILHISCAKCAGAAMIFVSQNDTGMMTVGVLTDATPLEAKSFFDAKTVSDNDVIAVHDYLNRFDGYTSEMF